MRQQLSRKTPFVLKFVNAVLFTLFLLVSIVSFLLGGRPVIPLMFVVASSGWFFFNRHLAIVSVDEDYLYVKKYSSEVKVHPDNIQDIDFWRWSRFLLLTFKTPTEIGTSVIFEPTGGSGATETTIRGAEAFESIGKLCGWRK